MGIRDVLQRHREVFEASALELPDALESVRAALQSCLDAGGKVLVCGNGGSAADAQHMASELVGRVRRDRKALPSLALTTDTSALTAIANDYGFDQVFARQITALGRPGDVVVAISTSGNSANVIQAVKAAREVGCVAVGMTGRGGGALAGEVDHLVAVPSDDVCRIQEMHGLSIHAVCEAIEEDAIARSRPGAGEGH